MNNPEKFWDKLADDFDNQGSSFDETYNLTMEKSKKYLESDYTVLDYGCATGSAAVEFSGNVKKIYGIDISPKMIETAAKKAEDNKIKNIEFSKSDIFNARFIVESFNVILAFNILHLLDDRDQVIRRINELLKPGGSFISVTPCMGEKSILNFLLHLALFIPVRLGIVPNLKFIKISDLKESVTNGNFQILENESLDRRNLNYFIAAKKL